jgi:hypothetical protein
MSDAVGAHNDLHSEQGALRDEHPGRSRNPVIKVADIAWLEFEKPDLARAEAFATAFGFDTVSRTPEDSGYAGPMPGRHAFSCAAVSGRGSPASRFGHRTRPTCCGWPTTPVRRLARFRRPSAGCRSA